VRDESDERTGPELNIAEKTQGNLRQSFFLKINRQDGQISVVMLGCDVESSEADRGVSRISGGAVQIKGRTERVPRVPCKSLGRFWAPETY
jgi:hypothetical protein